MIKLIIQNATLSDLTSEQLEMLDWKSLTKTDVDAADVEFISKNCTKLSVNMFRHACKTGKVHSDAMSTDEWIDFIQEHVVYHEDQKPFFSTVQLPYSVIQFFINADRYIRNRYINAIISTQKCVPMEVIMSELSVSSLDMALRTGSNPALLDFVFSPEGIKLIKARNFGLESLVYVTSTEASKLGLRRKNYTISPKILSRAGACSDGVNYCRRTLKELNVESIKWDEIIHILRTNKQICSRSALHNYIDWIVGNNSRVSRAND